MIEEKIENEVIDPKKKSKKDKSSVLTENVVNEEVNEEVVEVFDEEQVTDEMIKEAKEEIVLPKKERKPRKNLAKRTKGKDVTINIDAERRDIPTSFVK